MKILMLFPPQWTPLNPHFSLASLTSQLRNKGHEVKIRDLNIEFYNEILTKNHLVNCVDQLAKTKDDLFNVMLEEYSEEKTVKDYSEDFQKKLVKYEKIKDFLNNRPDDLKNIPEEVEDAVAIMKDKERFYDPSTVIQALNTLDKALEIASLPYAPTLIELHTLENPFFKLTMDSIKEHCQDTETNMFYDFYQKILSEIISENADMIGISINSSSQIVGGLTLAMLLMRAKESLSLGVHINIGGNFFARVTEVIEKEPEFFNLFCDSLVVEEGEKPIVELAEFLDGKRNIDQVSNLLYLEGNTVKVNEIAIPLKLNDLAFQSLEGFPLNQYFTPDIVLSIQSSRGCYWKKCTFCDHDFGQNYNIKDIDRLIEEIKYVQDNFGISHFEFIDESISPAYLKEMSKNVIESGREIFWFNNARLETEFTKDAFELYNKAGARMLLWGVESGSERIMKLINKGIDLGKRMSILKDSVESGIWNFAFIFFGFPGETREEAQKTIDMICSNTDIISSYGRSVFTLGKHTRLRDEPEKFKITKIYKNQEAFSPSYHFETSEGMNAREISEMSNHCSVSCAKAYNGPLWMHLRYREIIFLYICKYGAKSTMDCKVMV